MKDIYLLATAATEAVPDETLKEAFESEDVELLLHQDHALFSLRAGETRVDVRFDVRSEILGWSPDLLTGTEVAQEQLKNARGFYRVSFEPGKPQGSVAVFEALWAIRTLMEHVEGVLIDLTAFKLHTSEDVEELTELEFDIRDHITLHAVETGKPDSPLWVHAHGMSKFAQTDVEIFNLNEKDLQAAETFFHELCTDLAFGQGPPPRTQVSTSVGLNFMLLPSDEARRTLFGVEQDFFEGHEGVFLTVVSPEGRHSLSEMLAQYRDRFDEETEEEAQELKAQALSLLPPFKARFLRKGLMEPLAFIIRAPFDVHPDGEKGETEEEQLWVEVLQWDDQIIIGKLVDGGQSTTEWRRGAHVEVEESQINAVAVNRDGRTLDDEELKSLFLAERPM